MFSPSEHGPIRCYLASHFASHFTIKIIATVLLLGLINSFFDVNRSAVIEAPLPQAHYAQQFLVILILFITCHALWYACTRVTPSNPPTTLWGRCHHHHIPILHMKKWRLKEVMWFAPRQRRKWQGPDRNPELFYTKACTLDNFYILLLTSVFTRMFLTPFKSISL